jgi:hypothetical protein
VFEHDVEVAEGAETAAEIFGDFFEGFSAAFGEQRGEHFGGGLETTGSDAGVMDGLDVAAFEGLGGELSQVLDQVVEIIQ